ncbi:YheT family hydrolase [Dechloromonas denitrificans]|uniref:YheT family hydrolase n=1 Tax=Dechloromonas denitrificans TaxID=281362 RepID=UPI001CF7F450|nr:alpha/beta fold hydrolase [Dechloromonas denitrificans]UCV04739.1 alpha/beta fold hydrolase [Dechloromonas denitrificans]
MKPYQAPAWLPGGQAQTLWPLLIKPQPLKLRRERWTTPDGDFIDVDHLDGPPDAPWLVLFHGLEGSARSHYAISTAYACQAAGWRLALPHFRGCSGELNRRPRAYHSGDSAEIDWILRRLHTANHGRPLHAAGVSLGGNALLKWAGERGSTAAELVTGVAGMCAPLDLAACGHHLAHGFNRVYTQHFLKTLKAVSAARLRRFPGLFDEIRMRQASNLYQFDDAVTAPLHGFAGADDYWQRASAKPWLKSIAVPALAVNPTNDPFFPASHLPGAADVSPLVKLEQPAGGGHVGFVSDGFPGNLDWLPQRLLHFFLFETT